MATSHSQRVYIKDRFAAVVRRIWRKYRFIFDWIKNHAKTQRLSPTSTSRTALHMTFLANGIRVNGFLFFPWPYFSAVQVYAFTS
jgi:hypothetical protein